MNHIFEVFAMKKYELSKLYVCKIFEVKTKLQIGMRILYNDDSEFYLPPFFDPTTFEIFYTNIEDTNNIQNELYCKIGGDLNTTIKSSHFEKMFEKGYLIKEEIKELNEIVSEVYSQINNGHCEVV